MGAPSCFDVLQTGELPAVPPADWSSIGREELRLIQEALQRAEQPRLGNSEPALIPEKQRLREFDPASSAERAGMVLMPLVEGEGESTDGSGALGNLSTPNPLLTQTPNESHPSLPVLPAPLLTQHMPPNQQLQTQPSSELGTSPPPPRSFPSPSLPVGLNRSSTFGAHRFPNLVPSFGTKRRLLASQINDLDQMDVFHGRKRFCGNPAAVDETGLPLAAPAAVATAVAIERCVAAGGFSRSSGSSSSLVSDERRRGGIAKHNAEWNAAAAALPAMAAPTRATRVAPRITPAPVPSFWTAAATAAATSPATAAENFPAGAAETFPAGAAAATTCPRDSGVCRTRPGVSPTHSDVGPTHSGVCPPCAGVCLPQHPLDQLAAPLVKPLTPHPFEMARVVGLGGCTDASPLAAAAFDGGGGGGAAAALAAPAMPVSSLAHQRRQAAFSCLLRRLQGQAPGSTALHRPVSPEQRFEPSQGLSPSLHSPKPNPLVEPAVQPDFSQAHAHEPFTPNTSVPQPHAQHPFTPHSPQMQAAAVRGTASARESTPGGSMGFKSPSATPSPLSQSPRGEVGRAGTGGRQITGKSATEKHRRSRITERLEALKAVIPAEVLLRQQGQTGFSNRTQIATLLDAAVGFIEGMREYKLELEKQLLAS
ncbi:unnamed protein product [Closterium sp. NIES-53]